MVDERTKELANAQEKILKTQRLVAIGEAAAMVGHDLRNPLQAIVYSLYLANSGLKENLKGEVEKSLIAIEHQVNYMNKIVSDLQDYARQITPKMMEVNTHDLIEEVLKITMVPKRIEVLVKISDTLQTFHTDPMLMMRILVNLVNNAVQAIEENGKLTTSFVRRREQYRFKRSRYWFRHCFRID